MESAAKIHIWVIHVRKPVAHAKPKNMAAPKPQAIETAPVRSASLGSRGCAAKRRAHSASRSAKVFVAKGQCPSRVLRMRL